MQTQILVTCGPLSINAPRNKFGLSSNPFTSLCQPYGSVCTFIDKQQKNPCLRVVQDSASRDGGNVYPCVFPMKFKQEESAKK